MNARLFLAIVCCVFSAVAMADASTISGKVSNVHDADSITLSGTQIRLQGIDAPELSQDCIDREELEYPCGKFAASLLREMILGKTVRCEISGIDSYQRSLATCYRGGVNINQYLVAQGWATAYKKYDRRYIDMERLAKRNKKGLWQGSFVSPEEFRAARWSEVEENTAQQRVGCTIKGNINSKGDRIYHVQGVSNNYARTRINEQRGEKWFCSEAEAKAAGWRAPRG